MSIRTASLGAASLLAAAAFAGPALADGMPGHGRIATPATESRACTTVGNVGLTTDYVFRGVSQSNEEGAVQGGVDLTCGRFYVGVWGSSIAFDNGSEVDIYGGFKHTTGPITWDLGLIYYAYPGVSDNGYVELKVGGSGEVWRGGTLGATVFYSPDYNGFLGDTVTLEGTLSQALPKVGIFTPTLGATLGHSFFQDKFHGFDLDYTYWNVGLTLGFLEKWSVDLRYWDTNDKGFCEGEDVCDSRVVASVKYTF